MCSILSTEGLFYDLNRLRSGYFTVICHARRMTSYDWECNLKPSCHDQVIIVQPSLPAGRVKTIFDSSPCPSSQQSAWPQLTTAQPGHSTELGLLAAVSPTLAVNTHSQSQNTTEKLHDLTGEVTIIHDKMYDSKYIASMSNRFLQNIAIIFSPLLLLPSEMSRK